MGKDTELSLVTESPKVTTTAKWQSRERKNWVQNSANYFNLDERKGGAEKMSELGGNLVKQCQTLICQDGWWNESWEVAHGLDVKDIFDDSKERADSDSTAYYLWKTHS